MFQTINQIRKWKMSPFFVAVIHHFARESQRADNRLEQRFATFVSFNGYNSRTMVITCTWIGETTSFSYTQMIDLLNRKSRN